MTQLFKMVRPVSCFLTSHRLIFHYFRRANEYCFGRYPLLTNVIISGSLMATSDYIAQRFVQGYTTIDSQRTRHMVTYSCTTAPAWHFWYNLVDRYVKASKVWLKVVLDQTTVTPLDYVGFFAVFNFVEGQSCEECTAELNRVFLKAFVPDSLLLPVSTFIGYRWIPLSYRFLYFECLEMGWDVFLSYLKYSGKDCRDNST